MVSKKCGKRICKYAVIAAILLIVLIVYFTVVKPIQDGTATASQIFPKLPDLKAAWNGTNGWLGTYPAPPSPPVEEPVPVATKADIDALLASVQEYRDSLPSSVVKTIENMASDHPTSRG